MEYVTKLNLAKKNTAILCSFDKTFVYLSVWSAIISISLVLIMHETAGKILQC